MRNTTIVPEKMPRFPGIRLYIGISIFALSFFMLLTGLFVATMVKGHSAKVILVSIFWLCGPIMKISSVAILGKPSYLWIKAKFRQHLVRVVKPYHESRLRYNIGLIMFCFPLFPSYILAYAPKILAEYLYFRLVLNICLDAVFIASLFVLGGDFWDKLKALFSFSARANFPEEKE